MSIITKIVTQKKRKERYSIFLDDEYAFGVEESILIQYGLRKGMELSNETIEEIRNEDNYQRVYLQVINFLSYRMRTIQEMEQYLMKKEIDRIWVEKIIITLIEKNHLNDRDFALAFVKDRMNHSTKGPKQIEEELMKKGVQLLIIQEVIAQYNAETQTENIEKWLRKEQRKKTKHAYRKRMDQLRVKLYQKGFDKEIIQQVFKENQPEMDQTEEQHNFEKEANKALRKFSKKHEGYELHMKLKASLYRKGFQGDMIDKWIETLKTNQ